MVKRKVIWSPRAKNDLISILDYYVRRNGSKTYSIKLNKTLRNTIRLLHDHPEMGVKSDVQGVRNLIQGDFGIFYEIKRDIIEIVTIWDSRQDPEKKMLK
jgi:plasmid stabilization system protein ParE